MDADSGVVDSVPAGDETFLDVVREVRETPGQLPLPFQPAEFSRRRMGVGEGGFGTARDHDVVLVIELPAGAAVLGGPDVVGADRRSAGHFADVAGGKICDQSICRRGRAHGLRISGHHEDGTLVNHESQLVNILVGGDLRVGQLAAVEADAVDRAGEKG